MKAQTDDRLTKADFDAEPWQQTLMAVEDHSTQPLGQVNIGEPDWCGFRVWFHLWLA